MKEESLQSAVDGIGSEEGVEEEFYGEDAPAKTIKPWTQCGRLPAFYIDSSPL